MDQDIKLMVVLGKLNKVFLGRLFKNIESLGMNASWYLMLAHLNTVGKARTQKLGEVALITSGSITPAVNKMEKIGYVKKEQCQEDKRITWVKLTPKGKEVFDEVHKEHIKYLNDMLSSFTENEKEDFVDKIKYFGKTIEQMR